MRLAIIGAGISGLVAAGFFKSFSPDIYEAKESAVTNHHAVMRVRDEKIGMILGAPTEKVMVEKSVCLDGVLSAQSSIRANNLYSMKMDGQLSSRSIFDTSRVSRYLVNWGAINFPVKYGCKFAAIEGNTFFVGGDGVLLVDAANYDAIISTIPMPEMMDMLGMMHDPNMFKWREIQVSRGKLKMESEVHQTIYYPDPCFPAYRATIEKDVIIIESFGRAGGTNLKRILHDFGLSFEDVGGWKTFKQKYGKLYYTDDDARRRVILELSEKYNIFSAGRFAIWKQIRVDDLVGDLEKISRMLRISTTRRKYEGRIG